MNHFLIYLLGQIYLLCLFYLLSLIFFIEDSIVGILKIYSIKHILQFHSTPNLKYKKTAGEWTQESSSSSSDKKFLNIIKIR